MVCYSDKIKNLAAKLVLGISIVLGLLGLISAALGAMSNDFIMEKTNLQGFELPAVNTGTLSNAIIALGVFAIITGCLGCLTSKKKKFYFALPFMILTFVVGLALCIVGFLVFGFGQDLAAKGTAAACSKINAASDPLPQQYDNFVSKVLCTDACPCWSGKIGEAEGDGAIKAAWDKVEPARYQKAGIEKKNMKWSDDPEQSSNNWLQCFNKNIEKSNDGKWNNLKAFVKGEGFNFIKSAESTFECAGVCRPGFYYLTKDLSEGIPEKDCLSAFVDDFPTKFRTPALVALVTGICLLFAFICSFPLCSDFSSKNNMMDE